MLKELLAKLPINVELIRNPMNWVIILLMIAIAGAAIAFIIPNGRPTIQE